LNLADPGPDNVFLDPIRCQRITCKTAVYPALKRLGLAHQRRTYGIGSDKSRLHSNKKATSVRASLNLAPEGVHVTTDVSLWSFARINVFFKGPRSIIAGQIRSTAA